MVSQLNNTGLRFYLNQNESLGAPYSYFLDYPYSLSTGLNHASNQQNQLGPSTGQAPEEKKAKKPKKKAGVEKNSKDNLSSEDLSKESLIGWLKSLSLDQRFEVFSVKDKWLATAFIQMYKNWKDCHDIGFQVLPEENNKQSSEKNDSKFGELKDHFYCRKYISVSFSDKKLMLDKAQEEIIESVRLYDDRDYYDTIVLKEELIQDIDRLLELFDLISEEKAFTKPNTDTSQKGLNVEASTWFNSTSLQTLGAWIVSSFEKQVWTEYLENKKGQASFQGTLDFKMIVNYRRNLIDFWKGLEKTKKKKIAFEANETGKYLVAVNPRLNLNNQDKEINEGLKELYDSKLFAEARGPNPQESIAQYFNSLVENENESLVIDTFFFTSLTHFGTTTNLICRKLAHKLSLLLCEKIASDLILNEEKEKRNNNKKKNKKKKTKKTNTQQNDMINDEEIIIEQENNFQIQLQDKDQVQQENLKSVINEEESKLTDRSDSERPRYEDYIPLRSSSQDSRENEAYSEQIANLKGRHQAAKEADSRKTTTSAKNNFADASTSNGSETEEKFDPETNSVLPTKKTKIEENQIKIEKEEKIPENQGIVDDWTLFEESENKVSKSSKKRQKRKLKKKAIQESLKAQEEQSKSEFDAEADADADTTPKTDTTSKENKLIATPEIKTNSSLSNPKQADSKVSSRKSSEASENTKSEKDKKEKAEDLTKSSAVAITPQEFDDFGFIEVKAKKKTEKEKKSKSKKDGKESWRRNKEREPVEKKKPQKEAPKSKLIVESTTTKKSTAAPIHPIKLEKAASTPPVQKVVTTIEKAIEGGENSNLKPKSKETNKVSLIIPPATKQKVLTPPSLKTAASNPPASGSSSASESETTSCTSKEVSQTSTSSTINPSEHNHNHHSSHSAPKNLKAHKTYHPLSLTSPSLDPETIRIAKVKEYANEFFNKKFKNDLYQHVSGLTEGSNKIMNYRIMAYHRLTYCISKLFPNSPVKTKIFGSCATGLALTSSDVDISVSGIEAYDKFQICEHLSTISQCLKQFKWVVENKPILTASVPILKIEIEIQKNFGDIIEGTDPKGLYKIPLDPQEKLDVEDGVDLGDLRIRVDLSLESMGMSAYSVHIGYKTTDFVQKMLQKYESLYIVTMILKEFLNSRKFLNNFQGGISSYCLVIMIIAIFQKFGDEGYMESLKRFLSFYGGTFKPEILGITLLEADPFFPLNHSYETAPFWVIEHSTFQGKNIGGGCYLIKFILHEFEKASKTIEYFRQKVEKTVLHHQEALNCADDIEKVDGDQEFKSIMNSNILNLIINDV